eukprot:Gb_22982 [translate_table: standard]
MATLINSKVTRHPTITVTLSLPTPNGLLYLSNLEDQRKNRFRTHVMDLPRDMDRTIVEDESHQTTPGRRKPMSKVTSNANQVNAKKTGKLVFYEVERQFELKDLLHSEAELLGRGGFGIAYKTMKDGSLESSEAKGTHSAEVVAPFDNVDTWTKFVVVPSGVNLAIITILIVGVATNVVFLVEAKVDV